MIATNRRTERQTYIVTLYVTLQLTLLSFKTGSNPPPLYSIFNFQKTCTDTTIIYTPCSALKTLIQPNIT